jgi:hypothetical protein
MNITNTCKSCKIFRYNIPVRCTMLQDGLEKECPCNSCIVQVMCKDTCELRNEFKVHVYNKNRKW